MKTLAVVGRLRGQVSEFAQARHRRPRGGRVWPRTTLLTNPGEPVRWLQELCGGAKRARELKAESEPLTAQAD